MKKNKRIIKILLIITGIALLFSFISIVIYEVNDFLNDYRCSHLPINEFFQDETCEKYWRDNNDRR